MFKKLSLKTGLGRLDNDKIGLIRDDSQIRDINLCRVCGSILPKGQGACPICHGDPNYGAETPIRKELNHAS